MKPKTAEDVISRMNDNWTCVVYSNKEKEWEMYDGKNSISEKFSKSKIRELYVFPDRKGVMIHV